MDGSQEEEESGVKDDKLHQKFKNLQQDWNSYKKSNPRHYRRCSSDVNSTVSILQLFDSSPRNLLSSLQQHKQSPEEVEEWKVRNNDLAVLEILSDRRAVIQSGKLKGRRLFEELETANKKMGLKGEEEICSGCSSVLIQGREVRSLCSYSSTDADEYLGGGRRCSSSRTSPVPVKKAEREKVMVLGGVEEKGVVDDGGWGDGGKWMVLMGWLAIVLMVFALCIISLSSFDGHFDKDDEPMFPT